MNNAHDFVAMTERFALEIIGLPIPSTPSRLSVTRKDWAMRAFNEEIAEFHKAETLEDEADALVDLAYFALGRLVEMGLAPKPLFEEVHKANMSKKRGELSKRPGSLGHDAVKPEGWTPPNLEPLLQADLQDVEFALTFKPLRNVLSPFKYDQKHTHADHVAATMGFDLGAEPVRRPKIILLGHGRHGKDVVADMLAAGYGLRHTSSSMFCAERVVYPTVKALWDRYNGASLTRVPKPMIPNYTDAQDCFEDRHNRRAFWFETIKSYNDPDLHRLASELFEDFDVYVGLRNHRELYAIEARAMADLVIWVDRSEHVPPESDSSCTVQPWMADVILDNNGTLEQTAEHLQAIMENWLGSFYG